MILVVGASGRLGGTIARHLLGQGERVRTLTRTPAKLENLKALEAEGVSSTAHADGRVHSDALRFVFIAAIGDVGSQETRSACTRLSGGQSAR